MGVRNLVLLQRRLSVASSCPWETVDTCYCSGTRGFASSLHLAKPRSKHEKPRFRDTYTIKAEQARVAANVARGAETRARRAIIAGDPIRGAPEATPFVKSLDEVKGSTKLASSSKYATQQDESQQQSAVSNISVTDASTEAVNGVEQVPSEVHGTTTITQTSTQLNHFFSGEDLKQTLADSKRLSAPYIAFDRSQADPSVEEEAQKQNEYHHAIRQEAVSRIMSPENASSRQRTRINVQRCIETFGRHNTDKQFGQESDSHTPVALRDRAGADTGSSEVQIAILTAKIRILYNEYEGRSKNDKVNKRNLRLLLHRRQKLLKYFERKDRGGQRWHNLLSTLGLSPATWKGEINVR